MRSILQVLSFFFQFIVFLSYTFDLCHALGFLLLYRITYVHYFVIITVLTNLDTLMSFTFSFSLSFILIMSAPSLSSTWFTTLQNTSRRMLMLYYLLYYHPLVCLVSLLQQTILSFITFLFWLPFFLIDIIVSFCFVWEMCLPLTIC